MIKHLVFFKLEDNSEQNKQVVANRVMQIKDKISLIKHFEVGVNVTDEDRAYDLAIVSDFASLQDVHAYAVHPIHVELVKYLKSINTLTKIVDYEY
jgi:hypothetical protein